MQLPEQDEFSDFFAANDDEQASLRRKFFLEKHKEPCLSESALEDYQALFMSIYGINIDWKEGTFSLLEALSDNQGGKPVTVKFDYDSEIETATINLVDTQYVFHHYPMGSDGFDTELVRIEHILANSGYSLRVYQNSTFSDTLSFLLIPSDEWKRVEQHYSPEHISEYFVPYGKQLVIPEVTAPVVNYVPSVKQEASNVPALFNARGIRICFLSIMLIAFAIYILWNILTKIEPLSSGQPAGCENLQNLYSKLRPEVAEPLKEKMHKSLGCK
ncbi:hypothetical protein A3V04_01085 [Salmonella enterica subsp. enterica serovar Enteritidis]|nr:hypothetical protein [Salmonella enterica subsp. enterica serovar Enteritidis]ECZ9383983.1 hypothetical protein [Salmonella enterica subsp. enterica serovar Enteritidis]ECZ9467668.1 hypothetical protein [Salmonella enterica subsp. enterica serovar Enteritidis]ECZ9526843.1 hypothetical protein [Salmonella enterica subsp. enterica serovar Enteritidis]EDA2907723.1 hypothetical protein [Salmonella enterica subsp. enterica serovar Enteritidis]